jgi:hypothetical protein
LLGIEPNPGGLQNFIISAKLYKQPQKGLPMRSISLVFLSMALTMAAHAGVRFDPVSVHPAKPQTGQPILLLVQSRFSNGCGGSLDVRVSPERIDITQIPRTGVEICAAVISPFDVLINPQDRLAAGASLASRVEVRYFIRNASGTDELADTDTVEFGNAAPAVSNVFSGSFASERLSVSGLFVDQQEGVISTMLTDYDEQSRNSWRFGAGKMHGNVYVGELSRFQQIRCVTVPCARAVADAVGKIYMIALGPNELFVSYRNALAPDVSGSGTYRYTRLTFNRPTTLPGAESLDAWIPDLEGEWLAGVTGTSQDNADFKRYRIRYLGRPLIDPVSLDRRFIAQAVTNSVDSFEIICRDERPVDGTFVCRLNNYRAMARACEADFAPSVVTLGNLRTDAECNAVATEFVMQRLGR